MADAFGELGLTPDVFWDLTWEEFYLLSKNHYAKKASLYIQREILTRMINGVPMGMVDRFGRRKSSAVFPLGDEVNIWEQMASEMKDHIAFKKGVVYVRGVGFVDQSKN